VLLNIVLGFDGSPNRSFEGYFLDKNALGQFAALALLLALHELLCPGSRRVLGAIVVFASVAVLYISHSKTSLAVALFAPVFAWGMLMIRKATRISPAAIISVLMIIYFVLSTLSVFDLYRLSFWIYGDATLSGRTLIWDFTLWQIAHRPYLGWGYQSFWLVGSDGPAIVDGRGWVATMPNSHNGYLDIRLEMGYAGIALLVMFIFATLHAIGRVAERNYGRAWFLLSVALFVCLHNLLESTWMRGGGMLWLMFLIVAADAARYWQPSASTVAAYASRRPNLRHVGVSRGGRRARPHLLK
jgi:O-antigen ligase